MTAVLLDTCALIWLGFGDESLSIASALDAGLEVVTGDRNFSLYGVKTIK